MRTKSRVIGSMVVVAVFLGGALTTYAKVTAGLDPESGAATCPRGYGLENFESGTNGSPIVSTIPGVKFIATGGQNWLTGDWGSGYNGKYPGGAYTSGDRKWAWLGQSQSSGVIDFTAGKASYVSVYTSTYSGLVLEAYSDEGVLLESSGFAANNIGTGKMTMLSINRPTLDIGYVVVHDSGNYFLIDWLCTDAGVSSPAPIQVTPRTDGINLREERSAKSTSLKTIGIGEKIELYPLADVCPETGSEECNDRTRVYKKLNGYYWLRVKWNGFSGYVAEPTVMTIVPDSQEQNIRDILTSKNTSTLPNELIMAMVKTETQNTLNNEISSGDSPFSGILQVHPSESGVNRNCKNPKGEKICTLVGNYWTDISPTVPFSDIFGTSIKEHSDRVYMDKIYKNTLYSNDAVGLTNNIADALVVISDKYSKTDDAAANGDISESEMKNISTVYRYNQAPFRTQAIYLTLDPAYANTSGMNDGDDKIRTYLHQHGALLTYLDATTGTLTNDWFTRVRAACAGTEQSGFKNCLQKIEDEQLKDANDHYLSTSAFYLSKVATNLPSAFKTLAKNMTDVNESLAILWLASSGELHVSDSEGNITGIVNGVATENAANTVFDPDSGVATVFFPDASYKFTVKGTMTGEYGLVATNFSDGITVNMSDIPTTASAEHTYIIDWQALSNGQNGVTVQIDENGDGIIEHETHVGNNFSDTIAPITTPTVSGTAGTNNWYTSPVTVALSATDNDSGVGIKKTLYSLDAGQWQEYTASSSIKILTDGEHTIQYYSIDWFGNKEATSTLAIKIDQTKPEVTIVIPADGGEYPLHQSITADWSASDAFSGLLSAEATTASSTPIDTSTVGEKTYTVTATDNAGNMVHETATYYVRYVYSGVMQPVNSDGKSIFKFGSTVPVKFQLKDTNGNFIMTAIAKIYLSKVSDGIYGTEIEADSTSAASDGNQFRVADDKYIFNLSTKSLAVGTWQIRITLDDGSSKTVTISLR